MQLCPHPSSTISGFLLMANTAHSINPGQGNRWLWGLGEWEWCSVLLLQGYIAYATFGRLQPWEQILCKSGHARTDKLSNLRGGEMGFKIILLWRGMLSRSWDLVPSLERSGVNQEKMLMSSPSVETEIKRMGDKIQSRGRRMRYRWSPTHSLIYDANIFSPNNRRGRHLWS